MDTVAEFEYEQTITVQKDKFKQKFKNFQPKKINGQIIPEKFTDDTITAFAKTLSQADSVAGYVRPSILQLIGQKSLAREFKIDIVYLVFYGENCKPQNLVIAYDVIQSPDQHLASAVIKEIKVVGTQNDESDILSALIDFWSQSNGMISKDNLRDGNDELYPCDFPPTLERSGRVVHQIEITGFKREGKKNDVTIKLTAKLNTKVYRHPLGEFACVLPIPRFNDPATLPKHALVVGKIAKTKSGHSCVSGEVMKNIRNLSVAMAADGKKRVLIKGEPGSGKEIYALAIHFGSMRPKEKDITERSIANMEIDVLRRDLFGFASEGGHVVHGRIKDADKGSLFLDEFDKVADNADGFYSELLRVLETDWYLPVDASDPQEIENMNWIFAGAFSGKRKIEHLPVDLWSRLTHEIEVKSPIIENEDEYIATLFMYFVMRAALKKMGDDFKRLTEEDSYEARILRYILFDNHEPTNDLISPGENLHEIAYDFANYAGQYEVYMEKISKVNEDQNEPDEYWVNRIFIPIFTAEEQTVDVINNRIRLAKHVLQQKFGIVDVYNESGISNDVSRIKRSDDHFDSIRSIRQASIVVFSVLERAALEQGEKFNQDIAQRDKSSLTALEMAAQTLDIARLGEKAEALCGELELEKFDSCLTKKAFLPRQSGDTPPQNPR